MMKTTLYSATLIILATCSSTAAAECFCLVDEDDNFRHSCETQRQGYREIVHCRSDGGETFTMESLAGWKKLADGVGRCRPCRQSLVTDEGAIRGGERSKLEPGQSNSDD